MHANYDPIAKYYDGLSQLVFGDSIRRSQRFLLKAIPPESNILIVGGGTGWILEDLAVHHNSGLSITYVEQSSKMMEISQTRYVGNNNIKFKCDPIQTVLLKGTFDIVIVPFLFDNFSPGTINNIFRKIELYIKPDAIWLFADFISISEKPWTKIFLKIMYSFFRPLCNLETSTLPESRSYFQENKYKVINESSFYSGFIQSVIYKKENPT